MVLRLIAARHPHRYRIAACVHRAMLGPEVSPAKSGSGDTVACQPSAGVSDGGPESRVAGLDDRAATRRLRCPSDPARPLGIVRSRRMSRPARAFPTLFRRKRRGPHFRVRPTIVEPNGDGCAARVDGEIGIVPIGDTLRISPSVIDRLAFGIAHRTRRSATHPRRAATPKS